MANKPSERSKSYTKPVELNLIPYMDIVTSILIFMLFTSTGMLQIGVINVNAPRYKDPMEMGSGVEDNQTEEKQLNLTVGITYKGLFIAGVGGVVGGEGSETDGEAEKKTKSPTIPLLTTDQACRDALANNTPPPASCYDYPKLTAEIVKIKDVFPKETKVIIYAQPDVPYDVLVKVMDATREKDGRALFYDVILSPEIA